LHPPQWAPILAGFFVELAWKAGIVVLLANAIALIAHRSAAVRHTTWTAASLALLLLPMTMMLGPRRLAGGPFAPLADATIAFGGRVPFSMREGDVLTVDSRGPQLIGQAVPGGPVTGMGLASQGVPGWAYVLLSLCAAAVLVRIVRLVRAHAARRAMIGDAVEAEPHLRDRLRGTAIHLGMRRVPELLVSAGTDTPMVAGVLRPCIVLPAPWIASPVVTQHVLLHELAHVSRRDNLRQLVTEVAHAIYAWHPLVWWLSHQSRIQREYAADEAVLGAGVNATAYARTLLGQARTASVRLQGALHFSAGTLENRVAALLRPSNPRIAPRHARLAALLVLGCTMLLAAIWPSGDHRRADRIPQDSHAPALGPGRTAPMVGPASRTTRIQD
jgi:beta-lactamase regulating signal transducer with metallopeptidase domain